ncbi:MAG: hypothetical protein IT379_04060 [Deltaproteobacteria bacterium]|nr:hypothetical protein [Deltaproteobacteria bacterium]
MSACTTSAHRMGTIALLLGLLASIVVLLPSADAEARRRRRRGAAARARIERAEHAREARARERTESRDADEDRPRARRSDETRVLVLPFEGTSADGVRAAVMASLGREGVAVVPDEEVTTAAGDLGVSVTDEEGRRLIAESVGARAYVEGRVGRRGAAWRASVTLRDLGGTDLASRTWALRRQASLVSLVRRTAGDTLAPGLASAPDPSLGRAGWPAADEDRAASRRRARASRDDNADDDASDRERTSRTSRRASTAPPLELSVGPRAFSRSLAYHDDLFGALRPYTVGPAISGAAAVDWFPGGHFTDGPASWVGVSLRAEQAVALTSQAEGGLEYPTSSTALSANVRLRIPIDRSDIGLVAGYGVHSYTIEDAAQGNPKPEIPSVDYRYIRLGGSGRLTLSRSMSALFSTSYLVVTSAGEITSEAYFPRGEASGLEIGVGITHRLVGDLEVQVVGEMRRYWYSFHPEPGDRWIAGGASDTYFQAGVQVAYRMGAGR